MSLESTPSEAFLINDTSEDDFASLDSMGFTTGSHSSQQFGLNTVLLPPPASGGDYALSSSGGSTGGGPATSEGREGSISSGASGSLFDRIRARTAEQQKLSSSSHATQVLTSQAAPAQQSSQQQQQQQQQPSMGGEPTQQTYIDETTYSFTAGGGSEDFSQTNSAGIIPHIPVYGASRDDPYYTAANNHRHQQQQQNYYPTSFQEKATMALTQTGETVKSLWKTGVSGAQIVGAMAKDRMIGGGGGMGGGSGGERTYNNNFLLRDEDQLEQQGGGPSATMMSQLPSQSHYNTGTVPTTGGASSDQVASYSMLKYFQTFCEDLVGFVRQLPPWGKGAAGVILLWVLYLLFG